MTIKKPTFIQRMGIVIAKVVAIFVMAFCASVLTVIFLHADKQGLLPPALSLQPLLLDKPEIQIYPHPHHPGEGAGKDKLMMI